VPSFDENKILTHPAEFEKFFREKYRGFCLFACKYVKDIEVAEEVVQDVMVKLWEKREQLDIKGSVLAYINISVKNSCLNFLKHKNIVLNFEKNETQRISWDTSETEEEMQDIELETAVLNAIAELPPQRQKIFSMSRVDGLKYHEIADKMGLSIKTIEAQMGSALKQLRVKLKDYMGIVLLGFLAVGC
jgi:RNA polymerase sigma-70 factor (ECF subfamily)